MIVFLFLLAVTVALATPPPYDDELIFSMLPVNDVPQALSAADSLLHYFSKLQSEYSVKQKRVSYKYYYVSQSTYSKIKSSSSMIEVAATTGVSSAAHSKAARLIYLMSKKMPTEVFQKLAGNARVGIFTKADTTTIFPEYSRYADRAGCENTCTGSCRSTCTADGRKYSTLGGLGGIRATALSDNVLCSSSDPYYKRFSVLVHEFAHTVHQYGLSQYWKSKITAAYKAARTRCTWKCSSYGMSNYLEYFAEGTTAWFMASRQPTSGGMTQCTSSYCSNEMSARDHLRRNDYALYETLMYTWTNNQPSYPSGIRGACDW